MAVSTGGWASWAMSMIPTVDLSSLIGDEYEDGENARSSPDSASRPFERAVSRTGFYCDVATLTLKV